jgi:hypothetical protein
MSSLVTRGIATLVVISGLAIAYSGLRTGGWLVGILWGVVLPAAILAKWYETRQQGAEARRIADWFVVAIIIVMLPSVTPALDLLEDDVARWLDRPR